jgi:hypothetical protein
MRIENENAKPLVSFYWLLASDCRLLYNNMTLSKPMAFRKVSFMSRLALASMVLLAAPLLAWGHGSRQARTAVSYYCPVPVVYVPVIYCDPVPVYVGPASPAPPSGLAYPSPGTRPPPLAPQLAPGYTPPGTQPPPLAPNYAPPSPAPPSASPNVPTTSSSFTPSQPNESRLSYDVYPVATRDVGPAAGENVAVNFWNLTDHDLTLKIDGQARALLRGKSLPVELGRRFVWQVEGRDPQSETIAKGESGVDIVIRR